MMSLTPITRWPCDPVAACNSIACHDDELMMLRTQSALVHTHGSHMPWSHEGGHGGSGKSEEWHVKRQAYRMELCQRVMVVRLQTTAVAVQPMLIAQPNAKLLQHVRRR